MAENDPKVVAEIDAALAKAKAALGAAKPAPDAGYPFEDRATVALLMIAEAVKDVAAHAGYSKAKKLPDEVQVVLEGILPDVNARFRRTSLIPLPWLGAGRPSVTHPAAISPAGAYYAGATLPGARVGACGPRCRHGPAAPRPRARQHAPAPFSERLGLAELAGASLGDRRRP